jgi:hypothetical protein
VGVLAACRSPYIVRYFASMLPHGSTKLAIAMELMAASAVDLVSGGWHRLHLHLGAGVCGHIRAIVLEAVPLRRWSDKCSLALPLQLVNGPLDEATIAWVLRGTLGALSYLHAQARRQHQMWHTHMIRCEVLVNQTAQGGLP